MGSRMIYLVRCSAADDGSAEIVKMNVEEAEIENRLISRIDEELPAGRARGLHLAEDHPDHGLDLPQEFLVVSFSFTWGRPLTCRSMFSEQGIGWVSLIIAGWGMLRGWASKVVLEGSISCEGKSPGPKSNERFWRS